MLFKTKKKINVGIIGGSGYSGTELIRLLLFHPRVHLTYVTSRKHAGLKISSVHRYLSGHTELSFLEPDINSLPQDIDCIFCATPHGTSMNIIPQLIKSSPTTKIVDLSGDFRLHNPNIYKQYYDKVHRAPELLEKFVYGLPELNREKIKKAQYIANPGCFATGIIFVLYPLFAQNLVQRDVSVVSVTGSSGSGELPKEVTHHPVRAKNFKCYKILEHQHLPEIETFFKDNFVQWDYEIGFVPQSGPFVRGIFTTAILYSEKTTEKSVREIFKNSYKNEPFIRIVKGSPEITMVYATNFVELSVVYKHNFIVAMSAIDNLIRGASGQAIQNMNIMFGFKESEGLQFPGIRP